MNAENVNLENLWPLVEAARAQGKLSLGTPENLRHWLIEPRCADYRAEVAKHIIEGLWQELDDAFWTVIPFGTAGRRGRMYPIGPNAINDRTIGESAQGLADYVNAELANVNKAQGQLSLGFNEAQAPPSCAIAYDTRHNSRRFAELCAEVMVANRFHVHFFDGFRATPELSFAVRELACSCGIMVSASHNPPSDNAVKVFWSTGGQLKPPHDEGVIKRVMQVEEILRSPFAQAVADGRISFCQERMDVAYRQAVLSQRFAGPRALKILYSPLHGVGLTSVLPVLQADGFDDIEVFAPHAEPSGDFPNVPGNIANPENPRVFDAPIERAAQISADVILASDPDADRLGVAALLSIGSQHWKTLTGNQIAVLLAEYLLQKRQAAGMLRHDNYLIKTIVTTDMLARQAEAYGIQCHGNVLTGFKWIGGLMDELGPQGFIFGCEEAHGYLAGTHCRDKDGAVAAMLMAELAAKCKAEGRTLHEELEQLFAKYGKHLEKQVALTLPGADGMVIMQQMMQRLRTSPPAMLAGAEVVAVEDFLQRTDGGPASDVLIFRTAESGLYAAVRPSGTEPKIKFYLFGRNVAEARLDQLADDLQAAARVN